MRGSLSFSVGILKSFSFLLLFSQNISYFPSFPFSNFYTISHSKYFPHFCTISYLIFQCYFLFYFFFSLRFNAYFLFYRSLFMVFLYSLDFFNSFNCNVYQASVLPPACFHSKLFLGKKNLLFEKTWKNSLNFPFSCKIHDFLIEKSKLIG